LYADDEVIASNGSMMQVSVHISQNIQSYNLTHITQELKV